MCFYISRKHPELKIAERDIICWKLMLNCNRGYPTNHVESRYEGYLYQLGYHYREDLGFKTYFSCALNNEVIGRGIHSYSTRREANEYFKNDYSDRAIIVECYIPKGSSYYYNEFKKEYCSLDICLVQIIKTKLTKELNQESQSETLYAGRLCYRQMIVKLLV